MRLRLLGYRGIVKTRGDHEVRVEGHDVLEDTVKVLLGALQDLFEAGECTLTVKSVQNPSVKETFQVLVIQPAKKIQVTAKKNKVSAGSTLKLKAVVSPEDTTIKDVTWASRNPAIATVDENGVVTGKKRGSVTIIATGPT